MTGSPVVLINRTERVLSFIADGQQHELVPGENYGFNTAQARFAKNQNPLRGSEDYHTLKFESLVAIKGTKDPVTRITDEQMSASIERFDRTSMPGASNVKTVQARHRMLSGRPEGDSGAGAESMAAAE